MRQALTTAVALLCSVVVTTAATASTSTATEQECVVNQDGQCQNKDANDVNTEDLVKAAADAAAVHKDKEEELDPVWYKGTAPQIGHHIACPWDTDEDEHASLTQMHTDETWKLFNKIYHQVVPHERSSLPKEFTKNGYHVPIEIKLGDLGRGVFATEDIAKGTLIWKSTNTAEFRKAQEYRDFLRLLPQELACDVLMWAYVRTISEDDWDTMMVCADLDEGSFVNHGRKEANMELGINGRGLLQKGESEELTWYGCDLEFYARRDIQAGEEIRANYDDFAEIRGWSSMGL